MTTGAKHRIFFLCGHSFHLEVAQRLVANGVEISVIEFLDHHGDREEYRRRLPGSQIVDAFELLGGQVKPTGTNCITPPDADVLRDLAPYEADVLTLMSRRDDRRRSVQDLRWHYLQYVGMWSAFLAHYRPNGIFIHGTPHQGHDLVLYYLCRRLGIRTFLTEGTHVNQRLFFRHSLHDSLRFSNDELSAAEATERSEATDSPPTEDACSGYLRRNKTLNNVQIVRDLLKPAVIWRDLLHPRNAREIPRRISDSYFGISQRRVSAAYRNWKRTWSRFDIRRALQLYDSLAQTPDFAAKYVYLPLHYQPERSTMPDGGFFNDQLFVAQTLSAALPSSWFLYVKEHPRQFRENLNWSKFRNLDFYRRMAQLTGVRVMPLETSSEQLLTHCQAVATVTGTAGWEGLRRGKPAIVFGNAWYRNCPGVAAVDGVESTRHVLNEIEAGNRRINLTRVNAFIRLLRDVHAFPACFSEKHLAASPMDSEANVAGYVTAMLRTLDEDGRGVLKRHPHNGAEISNP